MITIYHNTRCSKSRLACQFLADNGIEPAVVEYLHTPFTTESLKQVLKKLNMSPMDLVRKGETDFKEKVKDKELNDDQLIAIMIENPKLIERPIVVNGDKAVVARPAEKINEIL